MPYACVTCTRRKVKCDKLTPLCSTCRKTGTACQYQAPPPRKRKRKPVEGVHERLDRYERLLKSHNILPHDDDPASPPESSPSTKPTTSDLQSSAPATGTQQQQAKTGRLLAARGKTRFVDSSLWKTLDEDELEPSSDEGEIYNQQASQSVRDLDPLSASILGPVPTTNLINAHPTYDRAMKLWQVYVGHVEPVIKAVHVPTGREMVQRAASNPSSVSKTNEPLLFAIYHFAMKAVTDAESIELLGQSKMSLQTMYYDALRQALINASFIRSTEFQVAQAYVLFLLSMRSTCDPQTFWILTGVAVRIAQRLGLHRDGEDLGLPPFEVQVRRRLFWQLLPLDGIAAQVCGTNISIAHDSWDTRQPLNIDDEDIWPGMTERPTERKGATQMIFCLVRTEIGKFHRRTEATMGARGRWDAKDDEGIRQTSKAIDDLESMVEEKYLRYCDLFEPTHCLAMAMARAVIMTARLRLRLPRMKSNIPVSDTERPEVFGLAVKIMDYFTSASRYSVLAKFRWHTAAFFQWDPMVWVLNEIRSRQPFVDPSEHWPKLEAVFLDHPEILSPKRTLHVALGKLTLKAWEANPIPSPPNAPAQETPLFITSLRSSLHMREAHAYNSRPDSSVVLPQSSYNSFAPAYAALDVSTEMAADFEADLAAAPAEMGKWKPELVDWTFWDQLIKDTDAFSAILTAPMTM